LKTSLQSYFGATINNNKYYKNDEKNYFSKCSATKFCETEASQLWRVKAGGREIQPEHPHRGGCHAAVHLVQRSSLSRAWQGKPFLSFISFFLSFFWWTLNSPRYNFSNIISRKQFSRTPGLWQEDQIWCCKLVITSPNFSTMNHFW